MTNNEIVQFCNKINGFKSKKLPIRLSYAIKVNIEKISPFASAYNEQVDEIKRKHEDPKEILDELTELMETEVNIEIQKVDMETLEKCDLQKFDSLTLEEIESLGFMIL